MSTPNKKIDNPIIIKIAPITNRKSKRESRGAKVKCRMNTISVIGSTAYKTSFSFDSSTFNLPSFLSYVFYVVLCD